MSDTTREALARKLLEYVSAQRLDWMDAQGLYVNFEGGLDLLGAADAILAEFLVVSRDSIVGTEYAAQWADPGHEPRTLPESGKEAALADAAHFRRVQQNKGLPVNARAVERPVPPWSVIPLPDNGEQG